MLTLTMSVHLMTKFFSTAAVISFFALVPFGSECVQGNKLNSPVAQQKATTAPSVLLSDIPESVLHAVEIPKVLFGGDARDMDDAQRHECTNFGQTCQGMRYSIWRHHQQKMLRRINAFPHAHIAFYRAAADAIWPVSSSPKALMFDPWTTPHCHYTDRPEEPGAQGPHIEQLPPRNMEQVRFIVEQGMELGRLTDLQLNRLYVRACRAGWREARMFLKSSVSKSPLFNHSEKLCAFNEKTGRRNDIAYEECGKRLRDAILNKEEPLSRLVDDIRTSLCLDYTDPTGYGASLLGIAIATKRGPQLTRAMLEEGVDPRIRSSKYVWDSIVWVIRDFGRPDSAEIVELLLSYGHPVRCPINTDGDTALHYSKTTAVTEVLLRAGANIDARNKDGETALHSAVYTTDIDKIKQLLDAGADASVQDRRGETPLILGVLSSDQDLVPALLHGHGALAVNTPDDRKVTPLHMAVNFMMLRDAELFLEAGANPNAVDDQGRTPLKLALSNLRTTTDLSQTSRLVRLLVRYNADTTGIDPSLLHEVLNHQPEE